MAADDGAAILIVETLCLTANLCIKSLYQSQVFRIVAPHLQRLGEEPVRKATTAYLTVTEWADTDDDGHFVLLTELEEVAQVALTVPKELSFYLFMETPEHVGWQHIDTAGLHF